jgi:O-antigen/teichoic acid export membrane protein
MGKIKQLFRSNYIKNALVLAGGTALAQLIGVISALILARIYSPGSYGMLTIYVAVSGLLGCMASGQFHNVIITTRNTSEVSCAIRVCFISAATVALLSGILVLIFFNRFDYWFAHAKGKYWMLLIPVSVWITGVNYTLSTLVSRLGKFRLLAISRIIGALLVPAVSVLLGLLLKDETGLFVGIFVSQLIPALMLWRTYRKTSFRFMRLSVADIKAFLREYRNYPLFVLPAELINNLINMLPVFMLTRNYNGVRNGLTGHYGRSTLILGMPVQLVSGALGEVFRQKASAEFGNAAQLRRTFMQTAGILFVLSVVPFALIMLYGPALFSLLMGAQWHEAGAMASAMALLFAFRFTATPLLYMYNIAKKQRESFILNLLMFLAGVASFSVSHYLYPGNHLSALWLYGAVYAAVYAVSFIRAYQFCGLGVEEHAEEQVAPALMVA